MIETPFVLAEIILAILWVLFRTVVCISGQKFEWKRELALIAMYVNLAVILRFTFFPMATVDGKVQPLVMDFSNIYPFRVNFIPFVHMFDYSIKKEMMFNIIGNIAMFIPTGIILPILYKKLDSFWKVVGTGFMISLFIEILQLPFSSRATDVDDLILNTTGVIIGYAIYSFFRFVTRETMNARLKFKKSAAV